MTTDNRKVLESIPEPASLDRTMPAPRTPAEEGKNLGGITQTADSGIRSARKSADSAGTQDLAPKVGAGDRPGKPSGANQANNETGGNDKAAADDAHTPEDESPLESLGRAIGAPLSGEAAEKEPRR